MKLSTYIKKNSTTLFIVTLLILLAGCSYYSYCKGNVYEKHSAFNPELSYAPLNNNGDVNVNAAKTSAFASINDVTSTSLPQSSSPTIDPKELLPKDNNSEWNKLNPAVSSNVGNVNFVTPGPYNYMVTSKPLRNPNLQLRSDPVVPQVPVSPWNNTTIGPDETRRTLDIGVKC